MIHEFKEGNIVRLGYPCMSGMPMGTVGILVRKCGFHRGNGLHFHMIGKNGKALGQEAHKMRMVCRNSKKWQLAVSSDGKPLFSKHHPQQYGIFRRVWHSFLCLIRVMPRLSRDNLKQYDR